MNTLIRQLNHFLIDEKKPLIDFKDDLETILENITHVDELKKMVKYDFEKYFRNQIYVKENEFEIVIIGWYCDQETSVHGHPNGGCLFSVLEGSLLETRYPSQKSTLLEKQNGVRYIDNTLGKHSVICVSTSPSISLHIYSPPFFQNKKMI